MTKIPPYLQKGDYVGIVCPAGYMGLEKIEACVQILEDWGFHVKIGLTVGGNSSNYFSGTDKQRLDDFQTLLDDPDIKAILCARGGYGVGRIIDKLNFKSFKKNPKWIIGYSDITILLAHIYSCYNIASIHGPMAAAFQESTIKNESLNYLKRLLFGRKLKYHFPINALNKKGQAVGELVGGNLSLIAHLVGSDSELKTKGKILFIEEVNEYLYNIDRLLYQLKRSGKLYGLAGLMVGHFTNNKDTERPFGKTAYEIISELMADYDYPVCFGIPVGHEQENYGLKIGVGYKLKIGKNKVLLEE